MMENFWWIFQILSQCVYLDFFFMAFLVDVNDGASDMTVSLILLLSWFKYGHPPVSSTGAFRLSIYQGVTAVVHGVSICALDPMVEKELIL